MSLQTSYLLFLDDVRNPQQMGAWPCDQLSVARLSDGSFAVLQTPKMAACNIAAFVTGDGRPLIIARNYDAFAACLRDAGLPDVVFLDHDLCDEHYVDGFEGKARTEGHKEKTGYDCALYLAQYMADHMPNETRILVVLHSMNPAGRKNMAQAIQDLTWHNTKEPSDETS